MPVMTGIPSSHLHRLIISDDVLIQFDLLMISSSVSQEESAPERDPGCVGKMEWRKM